MKSFWDRYLKYMILLISAASLAFGILQGEMAAVLKKAVVICMECIGIG